MNGLTVATLMIMAAVIAWGCTMIFISAQNSRLRDDIARIDQLARREIQHWKDEAARARSHADGKVDESASDYFANGWPVFRTRHAMAEL